MVKIWKKLGKVGRIKLLLIVGSIAQFNFLSEYFPLFLMINIGATTAFLILSSFHKGEISDLGKNIPQNTLDIKIYYYLNFAFNIGPLGMLVMVMNGYIYIPFYIYFWKKHYPRKRGEDHEDLLERLSREKDEKVMKHREKQLKKLL